MIGSLLDVVRFLEKLGIAHAVVSRRPAVQLTFNGLALVVRWELRLGRVVVVRVDEDNDAVLDRMFVKLDDEGRVTEPALLHLITSAANGAAGAATLPQG